MHRLDLHEEVQAEGSGWLGMGMGLAQKTGSVLLSKQVSWAKVMVAVVVAVVFWTEALHVSVFALLQGHYLKPKGWQDHTVVHRAREKNLTLEERF